MHPVHLSWTIQTCAVQAQQATLRLAKSYSPKMQKQKESKKEKNFKML